MSLEISISDCIQLIGIIASFITSIIAIAISVKTLIQNSRMIEESTRPYIGIYTSNVYIANAMCYLVVKNFGQSSAFINSFTYDFDISKCYKKNVDDYDPFKCIENTTLFPGQSYKSIIDLNKILQQTNVVNFHIVYFSGKRKYEDDICVNFESNHGNYISHITPVDKELATISETLQDMYIHSL